MKKNMLLFLSITFLLVACDVKSPMNEDLYPQQVYIVGANNKIVDRDLNLGNVQDTITVSIAVSGSRPLNQDVVVSIGEDPNAIQNYNSRELSAEAVHYQKLADDIYTYPFDNLTIHAGEVYNTYPIYIKPATLHCDSLYLLPLKLLSTSVYSLNREDTIALVKINMTNEYSGLYYMNGKIKNMSTLADSLVYKMSRNLKATDDGRTVRMYHYNNEYTSGDANDYRPTHAFKITVNSDNTLSLATWDQFKLLNGGGVYHPDLKLYDIWYTFENNGAVWRTEGYLYKERKTTEEQRIIDDWLEEHKR